ncbi:MAG: D-alanyl-D-alanine carboxypeptidase, partial [Acidobacteriota bacterium]
AAASRGRQADRRLPWHRDAAPLAELASPPLGRWLPAILEDSSNWHAGMLLRVLAAEKTGAGRLGDGLELVAAFLEEEVGLSPKTFALDDASGISPLNLWTPRSLAALLLWSWEQPWRGALTGSLAAPGRGTLEGWRRLGPAASLPANLVAKTGTARHTDALAGYLLAPPGGAESPLVFACLLNQNLETHAAGRRRLAAEVRGLARLPRGRTPP